MKYGIWYNIVLECENPKPLWEKPGGILEGAYDFDTGKYGAKKIIRDVDIYDTKLEALRALKQNLIDDLSCTQRAIEWEEERAGK